MNFQDYPQWNPFIQYVRGEAKEGETIHGILSLPDRTPMVFHPKVLKVEANKEFRWKGRLWFRGIFDGEHYFQVRPLTQDRALFIQGEIFTGVLVPFLKKLLDGATQAGFKSMNEALKKRTEQK